jgi:membrane associated rhomboid family serine protease
MFIPYNTERPNKRPAYSTVLLVAVNVFVFVYQFFFTNSVHFIYRYGFTPAHPTWFTPITSQFVHAGFVHLAGNMLYLYVFGNDVEDAIGPYFFIIFYLIGGLGAEAMHVSVISLTNHAGLNVPSVGASGAISALMGLYAIRFYKTNVLVYYLFIFWLFYIRSGTLKVKAAWFIGFYFIMQAFFGFLTLGNPVGVAYWAHIGGVLVGLVSALLIGSPKEAKVEYATQEAEDAAAAGAKEVAIQHWEEAFHTEPTSVEINLRLGQAYAAQGEPDKADKHFTIAFGRLAEAGDEEQTAEAYAFAVAAGCRISLPPDILFRLGCACEETGRATAAEQAWATLVNDHPQHSDAETALIRLAHLREKNLGDAAGVVEAYERYLRTYPMGQWQDLAQSGLRHIKEGKS